MGTVQQTGEFREVSGLDQGCTTWQLWNAVLADIGPRWEYSSEAESYLLGGGIGLFGGLDGLVDFSLLNT